MKRKEAAGRPLFSTAVGRCVFQSLDGISSRVISLYCSSLEGDQSTELQRCNYTLGALSTGGQRRALPSMAIAARSEKKRCKSRIVLRRNKGTNAADELARQENTKTSNSPQRFTLSHCLVRGSTQCPARLWCSTTTLLFHFGRFFTIPFFLLRTTCMAVYGDEESDVCISRFVSIPISGWDPEKSTSQHSRYLKTTVLFLNDAEKDIFMATLNSCSQCRREDRRVRPLFLYLFLFRLL